MLQTLRNAWKTPDIRRKLLVVLGILFLYRIGTVIPVPFVDASTFNQQFGNTIFAYMDVLSGGSLSSATLFALGVSPYITSSIILQLLGVAFPALGEKLKDKATNEKVSRYVTVVLAIITGFGYYMLLKNNGMISSQITAMNSPSINVLVGFVIVACYCAGASIIMLLGEKINENGIGNGISMILFANIISGLPSTAIRLGYLVEYAIEGQAIGGEKFWLITLAIAFALLIIAISVALTVLVVYVTGSERRIPIMYAKRVVGRKMYGGQNTHLPIKMNMTGVMPIIFASSIISLVPTILTLCNVEMKDSYADCEGFWEKLQIFLSSDKWFYPLCLFVLIILFAYFYVNISFNPVEIANNLKKNGGTIPGIQQGRSTAKFISGVVNKVTLVGALFLAVVAILPIIASPLVIEPIVERLVSNAGSVNANVIASFKQSFTFGGTSLLIVVGVVQETFRELEAQLTMRNYKGFL